MGTLYKETRHAYCNCERRIFEGEGYYDIPIIRPQEIDLSEVQVLGFNYAKGCKNPGDYILHFYVDDYQFERVWQVPEAYLPMLKRFKAVLAPDFSLYDDFPMAVNLYNHYRKHWLAAYWQENGVNVIPTICWGIPETYEWCFDGEPRYSTVSISCVGCNKSKERSQQYWDEFSKVIDILKPRVVLLFTGTSPITIPNIDAEIITVQSGNLVGAKLHKKPKKIDGDVIVERGINYVA